MQNTTEERRPVSTVDDLDTLDNAEILEGYHDGLEGFPCGENRSRSYWHGWRNGMADKYREEPTVESRLLIRDMITKQRLVEL